MDAFAPRAPRATERRWWTYNLPSYTATVIIRYAAYMKTGSTRSLQDFFTTTRSSITTARHVQKRGRCSGRRLPRLEVSLRGERLVRTPPTPFPPSTPRPRPLTRCANADRSRDHPCPRLPPPHLSCVPLVCNASLLWDAYRKLNMQYGIQ